jgi:hypothetical protein
MMLCWALSASEIAGGEAPSTQILSEHLDGEVTEVTTSDQKRFNINQKVLVS